MNQKLVTTIAKVALAICLTASAVFGGLLIADGVQTRAATEIWTGDFSEYFVTEFEKNPGSSENPFLIRNGADLARLSWISGHDGGENAYMQGYGLYFKMTNNIFLNDTTYWQYWGEHSNNPNGELNLNAWARIGSCCCFPFRGTFDGNGFAVYGIYMAGGWSGAGLFGHINGATIKNLGIEQSFIQCYGYGGVGAIVAFANDSKIINVYNAGNIQGSTSGGEATGGIFGIAQDSTIINVLNTGRVHGYIIGGIGGAFYNTRIYNALNIGEMYLQVCEGESVGGIIGARIWDIDESLANINSSFFMRNFYSSHSSSWGDFALIAVCCCNRNQLDDRGLVSNDGNLYGTSTPVVNELNAWAGANQSLFGDVEPRQFTWVAGDVSSIRFGENAPTPTPDCTYCNDEGCKECQDIWGGIEIETNDNQSNVTVLWVFLGIFLSIALLSAIVWFQMSRKDKPRTN